MPKLTSLSTSLKWALVTKIPPTKQATAPAMPMVKQSCMIGWLFWMGTDALTLCLLRYRPIERSVKLCSCPVSHQVFYRKKCTIAIRITKFTLEYDEAASDSHTHCSFANMPYHQLLDIWSYIKYGIRTDMLSINDSKGLHTELYFAGRSRIITNLWGRGVLFAHFECGSQTAHDETIKTAIWNGGQILLILERKGDGVSWIGKERSQNCHSLLAFSQFW